MTFEDRAQEVVAHLLAADEIAYRTGLRKTCPECKRVGVVFMVAPRGDAESASFVIVWEGTHVDKQGETGDVDLKMTLETLLDDDTCCGYDREQGKARTKQSTPSSTLH